MRSLSLLPMILLLGVFFCPLAQAGDMSAKIQMRYEALHSFEADFEQTLSHRESGMVEKRQGRLLFQKPLLIRWQTVKPHEEILVVGKDAIWDYLPEEELAYRYPLSAVQDSRSIIAVITGQARLTEDFDVSEEGKEGSLLRLHLYPKEPVPQMVEAFIWVEASTGYIRRAKLLDFYGNANDVRFVRFQPDAALRSSDFNFLPPEGIDIEDRSHGDAQKHKLLQ